MNVLNENAPFEFYKEFEELVRNSTLRGKVGTLIISTDWATLETSVSFRPHELRSSARPIGRGRTPSDLFAQVLVAVDPGPFTSSLPHALKHPGPGRWWWLCFVDAARPEGQQFLGVAVVEGATLRNALDTAAALGIHPGGRVASVACTRFVPAAAWRNRLLTRAEVVAAANDMERPAES